MEPILIKSKYKVTHILRAEEDYAAFHAVDIESRDKTEYLLNVYENELIRRYVGSFDRLRHCPEFQGMFMASGALVAVFSFSEGSDIDGVFYKGAELDSSFRLHFAHLLFHQALSISDLPPEIGASAMLSENIRIWPKDMRLAVNYMVLPMEGMCERELVLLLSDQIKKVLIRRFSSPNSEAELIDALDSGAYRSMAPLYSYWLAMRERIRADYERIEAMAAVQRGLYLVGMNLARWFKKVFRRKR